MTDRKKRILIFEDEKPLANALCTKLTEEGYEVEIAGDGEEGIDILKNSQFDLIFLDLIMPHMDGFEVLKQLKDKKGDSKIIVLSNLSQKEDKEKTLLLGADDFYIKTDISIAEIVEKTRDILSG